MACKSTLLDDARDTKAIQIFCFTVTCVSQYGIRDMVSIIIATFGTRVGAVGGCGGSGGVSQTGAIRPQRTKKYIKHPNDKNASKEEAASGVASPGLGRDATSQRESRRFGDAEAGALSGHTGGSVERGTAL
ncbi:hypothetical protein Tco_1283944 [Tanacetum coccineum]